MAFDLFFFVLEQAKREGDEGRQGSGVRGGKTMGGGGVLVTVTTKSRVQGMGVGERGGRLEGGGDEESMAIKEDSYAVSIGSRALSLKA